jgi:hypothetical protein
MAREPVQGYYKIGVEKEAKARHLEVEGRETWTMAKETMQTKCQVDYATQR